MTIERRVVATQAGASYVVNLIYDAQRGEMVQVAQSTLIRAVVPKDKAALGKGFPHAK